MSTLQDLRRFSSQHFLRPWRRNQSPTPQPQRRRHRSPQPNHHQQAGLSLAPSPPLLRWSRNPRHRARYLLVRRLRISLSMSGTSTSGTLRHGRCCSTSSWPGWWSLAQCSSSIVFWLEITYVAPPCLSTMAEFHLTVDKTAIQCLSLRFLCRRRPVRPDSVVANADLRTSTCGRISDGQEDHHQDY